MGNKNVSPTIDNRFKARFRLNKSNLEVVVFNSLILI